MSDRESPHATPSILALIAEACLDANGRARLGDLAAFADARGIVGADREALLASGDRLGVYRALVRNNLANTVFRLLPRTRRWVNALASDAFDEGLVAFLNDEHQGPRSPLLRDVVFEASDFLRAHFDARGDVPEWASELLDFERTLFATDVARSPERDPGREAASEAPQALSAMTKLSLGDGAALRAYRHAVHELDVESAEIAPPRAEATWLAISRDADDHVHATPLDALTFRVASGLADGLALGEATLRAAGALDESGDLTALASALATLADRGFFAAR